MSLNVDLTRVVAGIEYRNMSTLLADFRKYLEREAETPIEQLDANAALFLHDLCEFLGLGEQQRQKVLGKAAARFIKAELDARVTLPVIH